MGINGAYFPAICEVCIAVIICEYFISGKLVEPFDSDANEELKSHAMGHIVNFTVASLPPKYSDEPIRCLVQLVREGDYQIQLQFASVSSERFCDVGQKQLKHLATVQSIFSQIKCNLIHEKL